MKYFICPKFVFLIATVVCTVERESTVAPTGSKSLLYKYKRAGGMESEFPWHLLAMEIR
jgi:hypothetical protein